MSSDTITQQPQSSDADNRRRVAELIRLLSLETIGPDEFRASGEDGVSGRSYGGLLVAQALQAGQETVDERRICHSLHAYFVQAGRAASPIDYRVEREIDGRSFSTRRIKAIQDGKVLLSAIASFQTPERGFEHSFEMPQAPGPDGLASEEEILANTSVLSPKIFAVLMERGYPIEVRPCDPARTASRDRHPPRQMSWIRAASQVPDDPALHRAMLAYASDLNLLGTQCLPHGASWWLPNTQAASLDHAIWLHTSDFRMDEWLLHVCDSPWAGNARGLNRGQFFTADGQLVASAQQEGLVRVRS